MHVLSSLQQVFFIVLVVLEILFQPLQLNLSIDEHVDCCKVRQYWGHIRHSSWIWPTNFVCPACARSWICLALYSALSDSVFFFRLLMISMPKTCLQLKTIHSIVFTFSSWNFPLDTLPCLALLPVQVYAPKFCLPEVLRCTNNGSNAKSPCLGNQQLPRVKPKLDIFEGWQCWFLWSFGRHLIPSKCFQDSSAYDIIS